MRGIKQIVLVVAFCLPVFSFARDETMAERKQRIMRKYLSELPNLEKDDTEIPTEGAENESVLQSETYKERNTEKNKDRNQDQASAPPPPPPPRVRRSKADRNWLLSAEDPYASNEEGVQPESWSLKEKDSSASHYGTDANNSTRSSGSNQKSSLGRRNEEKKSPYSSRYGLNSSEEGKSQETKPFNANGKQPIYKQGNTPSSGDTGSLFGRSRGRQSGQQGYTPYKSPYDEKPRRSQQKQQRQESWGGQFQSGQEFKRQDPYTGWKKRNSGQFGPDGDNIFGNDMPNRGR